MRRRTSAAASRKTDLQVGQHYRIAYKKGGARA
jgi:hypothetical protein